MHAANFGEAIWEGRAKRDEDSLGIDKLLTEQKD